MYSRREDVGSSRIDSDEDSRGHRADSRPGARRARGGSGGEARRPCDHACGARLAARGGRGRAGEFYGIGVME